MTNQVAHNWSNKTYEYFSWYGGYHPSNRLQIIHYSRVFEKIYIYMMYIFTVESQAFHVWTPTGFASFMASELSRVGKSGLSRSLLQRIKLQEYSLGLMGLHNRPLKMYGWLPWIIVIIGSMDSIAFLGNISGGSLVLYVQLYKLCSKI